MSTLATATLTVAGKSVTVATGQRNDESGEFRLGDSVHYHGTMKGFWGRPMQVIAIAPDGRLSLVTEDAEQRIITARPEVCEAK